MGFSFAGLLPGLAGSHGKLFFDGGETAKNFMQTKRHIKDGFGLRQNIRRKSGFQCEKLRVSKDRGKSIIDVVAHLRDVSSQGRLGLRGLTNYLGIASARLCVTASNDLASQKRCHDRLQRLFVVRDPATQFDHGLAGIRELR